MDRRTVKKVDNLLKELKKEEEKFERAIKLGDSEAEETSGKKMDRMIDQLMELRIFGAK